MQGFTLHPECYTLNPWFLAKLISGNLAELSPQQAE